MDFNKFMPGYNKVIIIYVYISVIKFIADFIADFITAADPDAGGSLDVCILIYKNKMNAKVTRHYVGLSIIL